MVREIREDELNDLLELYLDLHEDNVPEMTEHLRGVWETILNDTNHHIIVAEEDGRLVSSCVCVIIPNLTRGIRPYAFIENVVTATAYRGRGLAGACLAYAKEIAVRENCYKMMLLTGSRQESTHRFYQRAGYNGTDKTAYVQWLD
ncbi:MAG: GNAT family N-acetyltransferase [Clostridia bacterium]|nr:GNAT family N-acetyltransferase [Clostridia bacterium]